MLVNNNGWRQIEIRIHFRTLAQVFQFAPKLCEGLRTGSSTYPVVDTVGDFWAGFPKAQRRRDFRSEAAEKTIFFVRLKKPYFSFTAENFWIGWTRKHPNTIGHSVAWDTQRDGLDQKEKVHSWLSGEFSVKGLGQRSKQKSWSLLGQNF